MTFPDLVSGLAQVLNFLLALLFWVIIGRAALDLIAGGRPNPISRLFAWLTDPAFRLLRRIVPRAIGDRAIPWLTLIALIGLRLLLLPFLRATPA